MYTTARQTFQSFTRATHRMRVQISSCNFAVPNQHQHMRNKSPSHVSDENPVVQSFTRDGRCVVLLRRGTSATKNNGAVSITPNERTCNAAKKHWVHGARPNEPRTSGRPHTEITKSNDTSEQQTDRLHDRESEKLLPFLGLRTVDSQSLSSSLSSSSSSDSSAAFLAL